MTGSTSTVPPHPPISCSICRGRKVKCSGHRPKCANCIRRKDECQYDQVVKRRGKDKIRGGRLKLDRPLQPGYQDTHTLEVQASSSKVPLVPNPPFAYQPLSRPPQQWPSASSSGFVIPGGLIPPLPQPHGQHDVQLGGINQLLPPMMPQYDHSMPFLPSDPSAGPSFAPVRKSNQYDVDSMPPSDNAIDEPVQPHPIEHVPIAVAEVIDAESARDGWWEWILSGYPLPVEDAARLVLDLCREFFADPHIWLSALHPGLFLQSLTSPTPTNPRIPHLILAILAHSTFHASKNDVPSQMRAVRFAEESKKLVQHSLQTNSTEASLAHAALILAVFEFQPHFLHSSERSNEALEFLIAAGRACWVMDLDRDTSRRIDVGLDVGLHEEWEDFVDRSKADWERFGEESPKWAISPSWGNVTVEEIKKEEMRRMCWIANSMTAGLSLWHAMIGQRWTIAPIEFAQSDLMYPGEALLRSRGQTLQCVRTPWALYHRAVALGQFVVSPNVSPAIKEVVMAQMEDIQAGLDALKSARPTNYLWQAQDWLSVIRRRIGVFSPDEVGVWFQRHIELLQSFTDPSNGLPRPRDKPLYCWWYLMQGSSAISIGASHLAYREIAIEVLELCVGAVEEIIRRYPCEGLAKFLHQLKERSVALHGVA